MGAISQDAPAIHARPVHGGVAESLDPPDERALMGRVAGGMWLIASAVSLSGLPLSGGERVHAGWVAGLAAFVSAYGTGCVAGWIPWDRTSLRVHGLVTAGLLPIIGVALWATGGAGTYLLPMLAATVLYIAYFYPPAYAWPLAAELTLVSVSPLVYDGRATAEGYPARALALTAAFIAVTGIMLMVKRRLVESEARQRMMATHDELTGVANRRAFDRALAREAAGQGRPDKARRQTDGVSEFALLVADLDGFKQINDTYGHPAGDRVLRAVAARFSSVVRPVDLLARIGGDEFALIAPQAGEDGARRLAEALGAAADAEGGAGAPLGACVAWALFPHDGTEPNELMRIADGRLYELKRARARD